MKINKFLIGVFLATLCFFVSGDKRSAAESLAPKRIKFQITTVAEKGQERNVLSQTSVEGRPGMDFKIDLNTGNFQMQTEFLSDLTAPGKLKLRAALNTRRFYGKSPANLPLYEEDAQQQAFEINFEEKVVLLPFGRSGDETLKIEITPTPIDAAETKADAPIKINFDKQIPSGEITISAVKIPHRFIVEAVLLADGRAVSNEKSMCLLKETGEIILQAVSDDKSRNFGEALVLKVNINKYIRSRPQDLIGVSYSIAKKLSSGELSPIVSDAAAMGLSGEAFAYPLGNGNSTNSPKYEVKFKIRPAPGEEAD